MSSTVRAGSPQSSGSVIACDTWEEPVRCLIIDVVLPVSCLGEAEDAEKARVDVGGFMDPMVESTVQMVRREELGMH